MLLHGVYISDSKEQSVHLIMAKGISKFRHIIGTKVHGVCFRVPKRISNLNILQGQVQQYIQ